MTEHITVYRDPRGYSSHPCITHLATGDWLVAFCYTPRRGGVVGHPPDDPLYQNFMLRSLDRGKTWEPPRVVPEYTWSGVETPGVTQLANGTVLLNQWRFDWYPVEAARALWARGAEIFVLDPARHGWRLAETETDWARHPFPYARADEGAYVHLSTDNGATWQQTVKLDIAPFRAAFSPKGAGQLANGDIVLALGSHDHDPLHANFVLVSRDNGAHWSNPIVAARMEGRIFAEPSVVATATDRLLLFSREEVTGIVYQCESDDGGASWSEPHALPFWGYPTHAIRLRDGRILIVYGYRRAPYGIRTAVSEDEGRSWGKEMILRDDLNGIRHGVNLGYPAVIEYGPREFFVVYYAMDVQEVVGIHGTYFALPG